MASPAPAAAVAATATAAVAACPSHEAAGGQAAVEPPQENPSPKRDPCRSPGVELTTPDTSTTTDASGSPKAPLTEGMLTLDGDTCKDLERDKKDTDSAGPESTRPATPTIVITNNNRVDLIEEEKPLVPGVLIRAATMKRLATSAVESYDSEGDTLDNTEYPRVLFLMHEWFVKSDELAQVFIDLYNSPDDQVTCATLDCEHTVGCKDCLRQQYRNRVCYVIRYWITQFPVHFDLDPKLSQNLKIFQEKILKDGDRTNASLIDIISKVPSYDWMRNMSVRTPSVRLGAGNKTSLVVSNLPAQTLAEQLTHLEFKAFRRMTFDDFKSYAVLGSIRNNPKLERSIALFNGLSQWIQCMVLCKTTPQQRADVVTKFLEVAKRLHLMQNYNTLMAVVGGLSHSSLARLTRTNACIPAETQKTLGEYTELLSSSNNFSNYRKALHASDGFKIPILGVHLKDLVLLHTALSDRLEGDLVNFRKMTQLSITFTELMKVQNYPLPVQANMDLVSMIKLSLDLHYTEDEIYELSLAREPRNSTSSPSTPTKPVVFADWVAGVKPPDTVTINKHVHNMVEAVFKNYDHDRDGFISHAEFEDIAGNFPFIDSFCVLDADQDGMISKAEMKTYFIRANCHALRNSFKHAFHETTYFRPTFCIHCTGLLWGLIKQGWKCKECGINAHKHCKDLVVMECRPKTHALLHGRSSSLGNGEKDKLLKSNSEPSYGLSHRDVTMASKRKMSQRQRRWHSTRATQTEECGIHNYRENPRGSFREEDESVSPARAVKHPSLSAIAARSNSLHYHTPSMSAPGSRSNSLQQAEKPNAPASAPGSRSNSLFKTPSQEGAASLRSTSLLKMSSQDVPLSTSGPASVPVSGSRSNSLFKMPSQDTSPSVSGSRSNSLFRLTSQDIPSPASAPGSRSNSLIKAPSQDLPVSAPGSRSNSLYAGPSLDTELMEDQSQPNIRERLQQAEEDCVRLRQEKNDLEARVDAQTEQLSMLRTHISLIRQHTVTFILNQMDTLHMQRDTEV